MCNVEYNNVEKASLLAASSGNAVEQAHVPTKKSGTAWTEARLLLELAVPTAIVQLGFTVPPFSIASYVGINYGYIYLDGITLASLTGNLCTLALLQGLYSASDTLSPQAFGAGNEREVGLLAMRGFLGSMVLIIPMNVGLFFFLRPIMIWVGEDPEASTIAWHWYQIYSLTLPFYALYMVTWKFLSAQNVMMPLMATVLVSCAVVLPLTLQYFPRWFGFLGTAWAFVTFQTFESLFLIFLLWWRQPHVAATWPGLSAWREALKWKPFCEYMTLGLGGMIASSEWIYWEALALMIGTMGMLPLSVHAIPTQFINLAFMIPLGVGIALAVRLGATLSQSGGVRRAKELVVGCYVVGSIVFGIIAIIMYTERHRIFHIFTTNPEVLQGCEEIWWKVCLYFFNLAVFGITMGTATGLGMQWTLGLVTIVFLWVMGFPAAYYFSVVRGGGLGVAWSWIVPPYMCINVTLIVTFLLKDWDKLANEIRLREGIIRHEIDIEELALVEETRTTPTTANRYGATETHNGADKFFDAVSD
jgi:MATE family multidrug resistance protein